MVEEGGGSKMPESLYNIKENQTECQSHMGVATCMANLEAGGGPIIHSQASGHNVTWARQQWMGHRSTVVPSGLAIQRGRGKESSKESDYYKVKIMPKIHYAQMLLLERPTAVHLLNIHFSLFQTHKHPVPSRHTIGLSRHRPAR